MRIQGLGVSTPGYVWMTNISVRARPADAVGEHRGSETKR